MSGRIGKMDRFQTDIQPVFTKLLKLGRVCIFSQSGNELISSWVQGIRDDL